MNNLRDYQISGIEKIRHSFLDGTKRVVLYSPTGCHAKGTRILLANGDLKNVENIEIGDFLINDNGDYVTVLDLHRGQQQMAKITPVKGESFIVNLDHILSLVHTESGNVIDISVRDWFYTSNYFKHCHKLFRSNAISFQNEIEELPMHPWLLGVMIGDGTFQSMIVTNPELKIQNKIINLASDYGIQAQVKQYGDKCPHITLTTARGQINKLRDVIKNLGLIDKNSHTKFIPKIYKTASIQSRLELLAGLMDTDGHGNNGGFDYVTSSKELADDIVFIARSSGLAAYISECKKHCQNNFTGNYFRIYISGDTSIIPTIKHERTARFQKKDVLRTGFKVELLDIDNYYGFEVSGNGRYLMGDFTVTHNSGKTVIAEEIIRKTLAKGKKVAFIANRVDLVAQTSRRLSSIEHGIVQGENTFNVHANLIICSIQTVARRGLPYVDLIIIDECHAVAGSKDYKKMIAENNYLPIIGLTATPFSKGLGAWNDDIKGDVFEELVVCATIQDLIKKGHLVDCEIYSPSEPDLSNVAIQRNSFGEVDYNEIQLAKAVDKPDLIGDIVKHWKKLANNKPTVVFATNIVHSQHIVNEFKKAGITAEHIDCYTDELERKAILNRVLHGETKIISNVGILTEGWDFPACSVMILARPTRSLIRWVQMAGRVLRPFEGKTIGLILDHSGSTKHLGYPTDDLPLDLCDGTAKSSEKRIKKEEAKPKECPKCKFMKPPKVHICPKCQFKPERKNDIETVDGELVKLERTKKLKMTMEKKQDFYSELIYIQREKGYKKGWAANQYRNKTGVWPNQLAEYARLPSDETRAYVKSRLIRYSKTQEKQHASAPR